MEGTTLRNLFGATASVIGCLFCFVALSGADSLKLAATFIISLTILMFYARKQGDHEKSWASSGNKPQDKQ